MNMMLANILLSSLLLIVKITYAQEQRIHVQNNTFNSSFSFAPSEAAQYNISSITADNVEVALNFERTNWATGSVANDVFYTPPPVNASTPPGSLLAVEEYTNTSLYTIAPDLALSRILFVSETLNGSSVPASAYILWPWQARTFSSSCLNISGAPVVAWAHGLSGTFGECAPSHVRNLWQQFEAPYILGLQGYVVVAPDYTGLGVNKTAEGEDIVHPFLANPVHANDVFYAVEAAQKAFPELSKQFVTMGHSQGGGTAWGTAQRQAKKPVNGYLGTVVGSPVTDIVAMFKAAPDQLFTSAPLLAQALETIFPTFDPSELLEPNGLARLRLMQRLQGCNSVQDELFIAPEGLVKPNWEDNWYLQAYRNLTSNGRQPISGPMLIVQGTADPGIKLNVTTATVNDTCALFPTSQITYALLEGVTHVPVLFAGQSVWLQWIEDRFNGIEASHQCETRLHVSMRSVETYQKELNYYVEIELEGYEVA